MVCSDEGNMLAPLPYDKGKTTPLNAEQFKQLFQLALNLEQHLA
jgi:hypothetical protein